MILTRRFIKLDNPKYGVCQRIIMMLCDKPDRMSGDAEKVWYTTRQIAEELNYPAQNCCWLLMSMQNAGEVISELRPGVGNNHVVRWWRLA